VQPVVAAPTPGSRLPPVVHVSAGQAVDALAEHISSGQATDSTDLNRRSSAGISSAKDLVGGVSLAAESGMTTRDTGSSGSISPLSSTEDEEANSLAAALVQSHVTMMLSTSTVPTRLLAVSGAPPGPAKGRTASSASNATGKRDGQAALNGDMVDGNLLC